MNRNTVYLFDISNFIHRAFHTTGEMTNSNGFPTGTISGTLNMMLRFIEKYHPTHLLICYDSQDGKSVRRDIYPEYKANRVRANDLWPEEKILRKIFDLLRMPSFEYSGYEADDLIASATKTLSPLMDVVIVTGDKDLLQLVRPRVRIFDSMKNIWYGPAEAIEKFKVRPEQVSDYLAIVGDKADNIPGVMGIGPKGAEFLLKSFNDIEDIYNNLDKVDIKLQSKLIASKELAFTCKKLTVLFDDVVHVDCSNVVFKPHLDNKLFPIFDKLEFGEKIRSHIIKMCESYN